ncbi:MAG: enolase N-terminal-like fold-containing protein [Xanthobacteraceae bacterium]
MSRRMKSESSPLDAPSWIFVFTGVKLCTGHVGAYATRVKTIPDAAYPTSAHAMPFPGKMRGRRAADFLDEVQHQDGIRRAVGIAAMNSLTAFCWDRKPDPAVDPETDVDAFDAARIAPDQLVVVVGTFVPFLRELSGGATHIWSWNRTRQSLKPTSCHSIAMSLKRWLSCCRRMSYG